MYSTGMSDSALRKTQEIPNLSMREIMFKPVLHDTSQPQGGIVQPMEEAEWSDVPTREAAAEPFQATDPINPEHYKAGGLEVIQIIEAFGLDYHRASALKYLLRAGRKDDEVQDLKKCAWFIDRAIQKLEAKGKK
jgi:hypothetical protein